MLPVLRHVPAPGQDPPQRQHRRVGGEDGQLAAGGRELEAAVEAASRPGTTSIADSRQAAVRAPQRELGGAVAGDDEPLDARESGSKSTSQIHETSRPSAIASFSASTSDARGARRDERADDLVRAGGVLHEQQQDAALADVDALEASERRPGGRARSTISSGEAPSARASDGGGERVVDVVEAGKADPDAPRASGVTRSNDAASSPCSSTDGRRSRGAAERARTRGSGSRRDGRRRRLRSRTASRSGGSTSSRRRAGARGGPARDRRGRM